MQEVLDSPVRLLALYCFTIISPSTSTFSFEYPILLLNNAALHCYHCKPHPWKPKACSGRNLGEEIIVSLGKHCSSSIQTPPPHLSIHTSIHTSTASDFVSPPPTPTPSYTLYVILGLSLAAHRFILRLPALHKTRTYRTARLLVRRAVRDNCIRSTNSARGAENVSSYIHIIIDSDAGFAHPHLADVQNRHR